LSADGERTSARDAAAVWAPQDPPLQAALKDALGDIARDLETAARLGSLEWFSALAQGGAPHDLVVRTAVRAPTEDFLKAALGVVSKKEATDAVLAWAGPVPGRTVDEKRKTERLLKVILTCEHEAAAEDADMRLDMMGWAIGAASPRIAEILIDLGVDPNRPCSPAFAIEVAIRNNSQVQDAKQLVRLLLQKGATHDEEWVQQVAKRQNRGDWLEVEPW
jgi:hypothetical protein